MMLARLLFHIRHEFFPQRRKAYALIAIERQPFFGSVSDPYLVRELSFPNGQYRAAFADRSNPQHRMTRL